jgi:hypothetical protein
MTDISKDTGVIVTLAERFEQQRLPRALDLKRRVDQGELLSDTDITFLEHVFRDAHEMSALLDRHPEWSVLAGRALSLYKEITQKALENQQAAGSSKPSV